MAHSVDFFGALSAGVSKNRKRKVALLAMTHFWNDLHGSGRGCFLSETSFRLGLNCLVAEDLRWLLYTVLPSAGHLSWKVHICDIYLNYPACNWLKLYADHHLQIRNRAFPLTFNTQSPQFSCILTWQPCFSYLLSKWNTMTRWPTLDDNSPLLSGAAHHCLLHRLLLSLDNAAPLSVSDLGWPFLTHAQGQTPHAGHSLRLYAIWSRQTKITSFFLRCEGEVICLPRLWAKRCRGTITQFKLYALQFEEDYDHIRPIYYFMWLLMILCTQPTQLITFPMNNKWVVK